MVGVAREGKGWGLKDREPKVDTDTGIGDIHHQGYGRGETGEGACDKRMGEGHWAEHHHCQTH
jgi:hypothetical protein